MTHAAKHLRAGRTAAVLVLLATLAAATGCGGSRWVTVRKAPRNPLAETLQLFARSGPKPTERTSNLLRQHDLPETVDVQLVSAVQGIATEKPDSGNIYALAELAYIDGVGAERRGATEQSLKMFEVAVANSYAYLFHMGIAPGPNEYDPRFRRACDIYNSSLESALRILNKQGKLKPGAVHSIDADGRRYDVKVVMRGPWRPDDFEKFEFASDYEVEGLGNHHYRYGLGVPLIGVRRQREKESGYEQFYPPGLSFPVTAFLRVLHGQEGKDGQQLCTLELIDPLQTAAVEVNGRRVPLQSDLSTPLAYYLDGPVFKDSQIALFGFLNPDKAKAIKGLYMLEPYDPNKIPVVMVHGLFSSPITWMEMFNELRSDPAIRRDYQFWFYLYPTGQPFWISATQMREDLAQARQVLDPGRRAEALDHMVLVGHSMGGLVSRLQTIDSGQDFWRIVTDKPFEDLKASEEDRERLAKLFFFQPNPSIRRVITIGTPHRGSNFASSSTRWLARWIVSLPGMVMQQTERVVLDNPGYFKNTDMLTIDTSIDSLSSKSPILPVMLDARKAPWVAYDNIVGRLSDDDFLGRLSRDGDGIVPFGSARPGDVESELVVNATHTKVHRHSLSILRVKRILEHHVQEIRNRPLYGPGAPGTAKRRGDTAQRPVERRLDGDRRDEPRAARLRPDSWSLPASPR